MESTFTHLCRPKYGARAPVQAEIAHQLAPREPTRAAVVVVDLSYPWSRLALVFRHAFLHYSLLREYQLCNSPPSSMPVFVLNCWRYLSREMTQTNAKKANVPANSLDNGYPHRPSQLWRIVLEAQLHKANMNLANSNPRDAQKHDSPQQIQIDTRESQCRYLALCRGSQRRHVHAGHFQVLIG